jgi:arylsulfatase A-like enzyme
MTLPTCIATLKNARHEVFPSGKASRIRFAERHPAAMMSSLWTMEQPAFYCHHGHEPNLTSLQRQTGEKNSNCIAPRSMKLTYLIFTLLLTSPGLLLAADNSAPQTNAIHQVLPLPQGDAPRWNILFIFADDWGRYASCYRGLDKDPDGQSRPTLNDVVQTPNVDRVAKAGVLFRNAFVNAPSCTPCRSSLFSGRYFFNCNRGAILEGAVWDKSIPTYPLMLRDSGYAIGKSYKAWGPGTPRDAPFGGQKYAYEKHGSFPQHFSEHAVLMVRGGMSVAAAREKILDQVRGNFNDFLAARVKGQPWHYYFGPTTTHREWVKGSGKLLWGIDPDSLKGKLPKFLPDVPEVREDVADYLGECEAVDAYVGVLMKRLEETGEADHTLIVISGDHGMPGVTSGKCNLYDMGVSVPLIIKVPGGKGGRIVDDFVRLPDLAPTFMEIGGVKPPDNLYGRSLMPLLMSDKSGVIDPARNWVITGRERHVAEAREGNLPYPMRSLHTPDYCYIRNFEPDRWPMGAPKGITATNAPSAIELEHKTHITFADMDASPTKAWLVEHRADPQWQWFYEIAFGKRPAEELYDVRKDPDMTNNLAGKPELAAVKKKMSARLMQELVRARDPRVVENPPRFELPPFAGHAKADTKKHGQPEPGIPIE